MEWFNSDENKPKHQKEVLVYFPNNDELMITYYFKGKGWLTGYWMEYEDSPEYEDIKGTYWGYVSKPK